MSKTNLERAEKATWDSIKSKFLTEAAIDRARAYLYKTVHIPHRRFWEESAQLLTDFAAAETADLRAEVERLKEDVQINKDAYEGLLHCRENGIDIDAMVTDGMNKMITKLVDRNIDLQAEVELLKAEHCQWCGKRPPRGNTNDTTVN